jgi:endonuclease/exonuclease/phosphatase family metal-dependent hydrolase
MTKLIRGLLIFLNILAVLALVMVKIGSLVNPDDTVLFSYASLFFLPIVFLNVAFVLFWILLHNKWALLSLISLLLFMGMIKSVIPYNIRKPEIDTTRQKITLLSYNTMSMSSMKKHLPDNPNGVVEYILKKNADIVCLQEFAVSQNKKQFQEKDFERIFKMYPYKHVSFQLNKWNMNIGLATLSKFPIVEKRNVNYRAEFNLSIFSDVVIGGDTIRVVNNHLESNRITAQDMKNSMALREDFSSEKFSEITRYLSQKMSVAYKVRAKEANEVAKVINNSPYKVICCGDFNDVPASYTYTKVRGKLKDAFRETGKGTGWTFTHGLYRFRIDYIMYDDSFQSNHFVIGKLRASDHFPVQTDLYLSHKTNDAIQ